MKINKDKKIYIVSALVSILNIKFFFLFSNFSQIAMMYKYSGSVLNFYHALFKYYFTFLQTVPTFTLVLYIIFSITIFYFWYTYFKVYFNRIPESKVHGGAKYKFMANIFTFLGFGCVACGQTLLYSILLFFGSNSLLFLGEYIGNAVMIIGLIMLFFGIYENRKLFKNKNICKISD